MTWQVRGTALLAGGSRTTATLTKPVGTAAGDFAVVVFESEDDSPGVVYRSPGFGWQSATHGYDTASSADTRLQVFWKVLRAADAAAASYAFTLSTAKWCNVALVVMYDDAGANEPFLDTYGSVGTIPGSGGSVTAPAVTTTSANALLFCVEANWSEEDATYGNGLTKVAQTVSGLGGGASIAYKVQASAGASGTTTVTYGGTTSGAAALHLSFHQGTSS